MPHRERVLLLHNRYRAAGGEERVVDELEALLSARGHAVARCERDSGDSGRVAAARALLRGGVGEQEVGAAVRAHGADVLHAHNVHPLFGWRALAAAREAGARTVLHLHNYRFACAIGVAYRDGQPCHLCHGRDTRPGLRHNCRGSLPESAVYATSLASQQPHLLELVDRFVAVGEAQAEVLAGFGLPRERVDVVPNGVASVAAASRAGEGGYALASGRLVEEKGFETAIAAARAAGVPLRIAGEGPDEPRLRALADGASGIAFLGRLDGVRMAAARRGAAVVLVPSRWEEACPMAAVEALADGVPVLASDLGGLPELVGAGAGAALPARDVAVWAEALRALWDDPALRARRGEEALARARARHTPEAQYAALTAAYAAAERAASARDGGTAAGGARDAVSGGARGTAGGGPTGGAGAMGGGAAGATGGGE